MLINDTELGPSGAGPETLEATTRADLELVRRLALGLARRLPRHIDLDELVSLGNLGVVEARTRYDASRGIPFGAFAATRIRGAMLDGLRSADPLTRDERLECKRNPQAIPA